MFDGVTLKHWRDWDTCAEELGLPKEWRVCAHCGEQSWRFPPHLLNPCPFVVEMAEAAGMKMDAERMQAVRAGVNIEAITGLIQGAILEHGEEDDGGPFE